jgi:predicted Fe-Mo cluster-binding NifX family protein
MKVAIASDDQVHVAGHIGRVRGFIIYSISDNKIQSKNYLSNSFTNHSHSESQQQNHATGNHHGHNRLIDALKGVEALIFISGGWRLVEDLKNNGIKPIMTNELIADEAIEKYLKGELLEKEENVCHHH